jgi:predicted DsbA family dithiol-disulfide isomerase
MKIEIWSDIMCPFCYIGKRKLEKALEQFAHKDKVEVEWKSYQLAPDLQTNTKQNVFEYLAQQKGWTLEYSKEMHKNVSSMANEAGLHYNFDKAIPANSFNAHRLLHLALKYNVQNEVKEQLFAAYFLDGKNIDDVNTLIEIGNNFGIQADEIKDLVNSQKLTDEVEQDIIEARQIGVRGVPFFLVDRKYALSGAQPTDVFTGFLEKAWQEGIK